MNILETRKELIQGKTIYDMNLKVAYYARVSTDSDIQLNSLEIQFNYYENYIKSKSNWIYVRGYVYEGISELLKTLHENEIIVALATSKPERFAKLSTRTHVVVKELPLNVRSLNRFEQYKKMAEKNPWLVQLRDNLGLELS